MAAIEGIGGPGGVRPGARRPVRNPAGFTVPADASVSSHAAAEAAPTAALAAMLAAQEMGGGAVEDREARRYGQDMLAALAGLQRELLRGGDGVAALRHLAELAAAVPVASDPRLAAAVAAIAVRVRVELARRQI